MLPRILAESSQYNSACWAVSTHEQFFQPWQFHLIEIASQLPKELISFIPTIAATLVTPAAQDMSEDIGDEVMVLNQKAAEALEEGAGVALSLLAVIYPHDIAFVLPTCFKKLCDSLKTSTGEKGERVIRGLCLAIRSQEPAHHTTWQVPHLLDLAESFLNSSLESELCLTLAHLKQISKAQDWEDMWCSISPEAVAIASQFSTETQLRKFSSPVGDQNLSHRPCWKNAYGGENEQRYSICKELLYQYHIFVVGRLSFLPSPRQPNCPSLLMFHHTMWFSCWYETSASPATVNHMKAFPTCFANPWLLRFVWGVTESCRIHLPNLNSWTVTKWASVDVGCFPGCCFRGWSVDYVPANPEIETR